MKKILPILLISAVIILGSIGTANADNGPYYLYWDDTCHILKVYIKDGAILYGQEIGCMSGGTNTYAGGYTGPMEASLGYHYNGDPRVIVYKADGTVSIYLNSGTSLSLFNSGTWHIGPAPAGADLALQPDPNE